MKAIDHKFWSYYQEIKPSFGLGWPDKHSPRIDWPTSDATVNKIRLSPGYPVNSFQELVAITAKTALNNRQYDFFYRGQTTDYQDKDGRTVIYPSICRPDTHPGGKLKASIRTATIEKRYDELQKFILYYNKKEPLFVEEAYALIQHYKVLLTPMIDMTQSLKVAASFALMDTSEGYLYMFGFPYPQGSISHFVDIGVTLVKLQNAAPHDALRPRYQEGFLVGRLPFRPYKAVGDNLAKRLIAKFKLNNTDNKFWDPLFQPYPDDLLFPADDAQENRMNKLYSEYKEASKTK